MRKHYMGSKEEVRALGVYVKLIRAAESLTARVHRHLAGARLTVSQFGALEALYHLGPLHQHEIGQKILKSSGNITTVIDNLEKRGLVTRMRDIKDRRCVQVRITKEGEELLGRIFPAHAELITREMGRLTQVEQEELGRLCRRIGLGKTEREEGVLSKAG